MFIYQQKYPYIRFIIKTICIVLIVSFVSYDITWAGATDVLKATKKLSPLIEIPQELGFLKESYITKRSTDKIFVYIQDLHANLQAQKNEGQLIKYLQDKYRINHVSVEGGFGEIEADFFRKFPKDKAVRDKIAGYFLSKSFISGPDHLLITEDNPLNIFGAEDKEVYLAHLDTFKQNQPIINSFNNSLDKLESIIGTLKDKYYSEGLKELDAKISAFDQRQISLANYIVYLKAASMARKIDLSRYSDFSRLVKIQELEEGINFEKTENERKDLIELLTKNLAREDLEEFVKVSLDFKASKLKPSRYYSYLKELAQKAGVPSAEYQYLFTYIDYIVMSEGLDSLKAFAELNLFIKTLKEKIFTTQAQKDIDSLSYTIYILRGFANISLSPEEYEYFKNNRQEFKHGAILRILTPYAPSVSIPEDSEIASLDKFYAFSCERDKAMVTNSLNRMAKDSKGVILVAGGFHTDGVTAILKEKNISYCVISPNIGKVDERKEVYLSLLNDKKLSFDEVLNDPDNLQLINSFSDKETRRRLISYWVARASKYYSLKELKSQLRKLQLSKEDKETAQASFKEITPEGSHQPRPAIKEYSGARELDYKQFLSGVGNFGQGLLFSQYGLPQESSLSFFNDLFGIPIYALTILIAGVVYAAYILKNNFRLNEANNVPLFQMPQSIQQSQMLYSFQGGENSNLPGTFKQEIVRRIENLRGSVAQGSSNALTENFRPNGPYELPLPVSVNMIEERFSDKEKVIYILENMQAMMDGTDEKVLRDFARAVDNARDKVTEDALDNFDRLSDKLIYELLTNGYLKELKKEILRVSQGYIEHMARFHAPSQQEQNLHVNSNIEEKYPRMPRYLKWLLSSNFQLEDDPEVRQQLESIQARMMQVPAFPQVIMEYSITALNKSLYLNPELAIRMIRHLAQDDSSYRDISGQELQGQIKTELAKSLPKTFEIEDAEIIDMDELNLAKALPEKTKEADERLSALNDDYRQFMLKFNQKEEELKKNENDLKELNEGLEEAIKQNNNIVIFALRSAIDRLNSNLTKSRHDFSRLDKEKAQYEEELEEGRENTQNLYSFTPYISDPAIMIGAGIVSVVGILAKNIIERKKAKTLSKNSGLSYEETKKQVVSSSSNSIDSDNIVKAGIAGYLTLGAMAIGVSYHFYHDFYSAYSNYLWEAEIFGVPTIMIITLCIFLVYELAAWSKRAWDYPGNYTLINEVYTKPSEAISDRKMKQAARLYARMDQEFLENIFKAWIANGQEDKITRLLKYAKGKAETLKVYADLGEYKQKSLIAAQKFGGSINERKAFVDEIDAIKEKLFQKGVKDSISLIKDTLPQVVEHSRSRVEFFYWLNRIADMPVGSLNKGRKQISALFDDLREFERTKEQVLHKFSSGDQETTKLNRAIEELKNKLDNDGFNSLGILKALLPEITKASDSLDEFLFWISEVMRFDKNVWSSNRQISLFQEIAAYNYVKETLINKLGISQGERVGFTTTLDSLKASLETKIPHCIVPLKEVILAVVRDVDVSAEPRQRMDDFTRRIKMCIDFEAQAWQTGPKQVIAGYRQIDGYQKLKLDAFIRFASGDSEQKRLKNSWDTLDELVDWRSISYTTLFKNAVNTIVVSSENSNDFIFWITALSELDKDVLKVLLQDIEPVFTYYREKNASRDFSRLSEVLNRYYKSNRHSVLITNDVLDVLTDPNLSVNKRIEKASQFLIGQKIVKLGAPTNLLGLKDAVSFEELIRIVGEDTLKSFVRSYSPIKKAMEKMGREGVYSYSENQKPAYYKNFLKDAKGLRPGFNYPGEKFRVAYIDRVLSSSNEDEVQARPVEDDIQALKQLIQYLRMEWPNLYDNFIEPKKELIKGRPLEEFVTSQTIGKISGQLLTKVQNWQFSGQQRIVFTVKIAEISAFKETADLRIDIASAPDDFTRLRLTSQYWDKVLELASKNKLWKNTDLFKELSRAVKQKIAAVNNRIGEAGEGVLQFYLSGGTLADFFKGWVSNDCTKNADGAYPHFLDTQAFVTDPACFLFKVIEKNKWVGNVYTFAFKDKSGAFYLYIDMFQLNLEHPIVKSNHDWQERRIKFCSQFLKQMTGYLGSAGFDYLFVSTNPAQHKISPDILSVIKRDYNKENPETLNLRKLGGTEFFAEAGVNDEYVQTIPGTYIRNDFQSVTGYKIKLNKSSPQTLGAKKEQPSYLENLLGQMLDEEKKLSVFLNEKQEELAAISRQGVEAANTGKNAVAAALRSAYEQKEVEVKKAQSELKDLRAEIARREKALGKISSGVSFAGFTGLFFSGMHYSQYTPSLDTAAYAFLSTVLIIAGIAGYFGLIYYLLKNLFSPRQQSAPVPSTLSLIKEEYKFSEDIKTSLDKVLEKISPELKKLIRQRLKLRVPYEKGIGWDQSLKALNLLFTKLTAHDSILDFLKEQDFYHEFKNRAWELNLADGFDNPLEQVYSFSLPQEGLRYGHNRRIEEFIEQYLVRMRMEFSVKINPSSQMGLEAYYRMLKAQAYENFKDRLSGIDKFIREHKYFEALSLLEEFLRVGIGAELIALEKDSRLQVMLNKRLNRELEEILRQIKYVKNFAPDKRLLDAEEADIHYEIRLSERNADDVMRGTISRDCTAIDADAFYNTIPQFMFDPGLLVFKVFQDDEWVGNIYTFVAEKENNPVLIVDAIQLPAWARPWPVSVNVIADNLLDKIIGYASSQGFSEVLMSSFVSNFTAIHRHFDSKFPTQVVEIEKLGGFEHLKSLGIWDDYAARNEYIETFSPQWNYALKERVDPNNPKQELLLRKVWQRNTPSEEIRELPPQEDLLSVRPVRETKNSAFQIIQKRFKMAVAIITFLIVLTFPNIAHAAKFQVEQGPQPNQKQIVAVVEPGDTLWDISTPNSEWPKIYSANPQIHDRPGEKLGSQYPDTKQIVVIRPGDKLNIPAGLTTLIEEETQKLKEQTDKGKEKLTQFNEEKDKLQKEIEKSKESKENLKNDIERMRKDINKLEKISPLTGQWSSSSSLGKAAIIGIFVFGIGFFVSMAFLLFRLVNFYRLREMIDRAQEELGSLEKDLAGMRKEKIDKEELIKQKVQAQEEKAEAKAMTEEAEKILSEALLKKQGFEKEIEDMQIKAEKGKQAFNELIVQKQNLEDKINVLLSEKDQLGKEYTKEELRLEVLQDEIKLNQEQLGGLEAKTKAEQVALDYLPGKIQEALKERRALQNEITDLNAQKDELETLMQNLAVLKNEELPNLERQRKILQEEIFELEAKKEKTQDIIEEAKNLEKIISPEINLEKILSQEQEENNTKVDLSQLINMLDHLSLTPSGVSKEEQITQTLKRYLMSYGAQVLLEGEQRKNIVIDIPATESYASLRPVGLNAHIDTTSHNPTILRVNRDMIEAEGVGGNAGLDDMAGVAVIMEAVRVLCSNNIGHRRIRLIFTAEEESGFVGARELVGSRNYAEFLKELYLLITIDGHLYMEDDMARRGKDYPLAVKFLNFGGDKQNDYRYKAVFDAAKSVTDRKDLPKEFSFSAGDEQAFKDIDGLYIAHFRANYSDPHHGRIDSIKTKDLIDLTQWLVNILINLSQPELGIYANSSKGKGMLASEEHVQVNEVIGAAKKENKGLLIWGDEAGWKLGKDKYAQDISSAISALRAHPPLNMPSLGTIDIAETINTSNVILIQLSNNFPPGLLVKDKDAYQVAHSGLGFNSIYIDEAVYKSLYSFEITILLAHEAIELGAKRLAKEKRIPWTTELAVRAHQLAEEFEIQIVGRSSFGSGSRFDDRIEKILGFDRMPDQEIKEEPKREIIELKLRETMPRENLIPLEKKAEEPPLEQRVNPQVQDPDMANNLRNMFLEGLLRNTSSNLPAKFENFPAPIADELKYSFELQKISRMPLDADILTALAVFFSRIFPNHTDELVEYLKKLSIYLVDNTRSTYGATLSGETFYIQKTCFDDLLGVHSGVEEIYQGINSKNPKILAALFRIVIHEVGSAFFKLSHPANQDLENLFLAMLSKRPANLPPSTFEEVRVVNNTPNLNKLARLDWAQKKLTSVDHNVSDGVDILGLFLGNQFQMDSFIKGLPSNPRVISALDSLAIGLEKLILEIDVDSLIDSIGGSYKLKSYGFKEMLVLLHDIRQEKGVSNGIYIKLININPVLDKEKIIKILALEDDLSKEFVSVTDIPEDYLVKGLSPYLIDGSIRIAFEGNIRYWGKDVDVVVKKGSETELISSLGLAVAGLSKDPDFYASLPQELKEYITASRDDKGNILKDDQDRIKQLIFKPIDKTKIDIKYLEEMERDKRKVEGMA